MYVSATIILSAAVIYLSTGGILALGFAAVGIGRMLPQAGHITLGARAASLPGAALLWPILVRHWWRSR
jgi:hypothetical protein